MRDVADGARHDSRRLEGGKVGRDLNGQPRNRDVAFLVGSVVGVGSLALAVVNAVQGQWFNFVANLMVAAGMVCLVIAQRRRR